MSWEESQLIAIHEAGHALYAVTNGIMFEYVEIGENEHGVVEVIGSPLDDPEMDLTPSLIHTWQRFYASGAAAERIASKSYRKHATKHDAECHCNLSQRLEPRLRTSFEDSIDQSLLPNQLALIHSIADALKQQSRLGYEEVCKLIGRTPSWHPPTSS